ncbi:MAG: hypothetical protein SFT92_03270 [Rickettsiales bacterium]|nr:hypothetical protein [Rickettsiales bacterium]
MRKKPHFLLLIGIVLLLPIIGYAVSYISTLFFPLAEQTDFINAFFVLCFIGGLLAIPYWMLKLMLQAFHVINPQEKQVRFKDIAKDQDQLNHTGPESTV